jgi:glycosyltransferase involved in cell wall biosynthesis
MKIAYLINRYPQPTHSFIRREILALEALGLTIERLSLRPSGNLLDASDLSEQKRTRVVLESGALRLLARAAAVALARPLQFLRALLLALRIGWKSDRGLLRNLAYFVEACTVAEWLRQSGVTHVHAHFGTNSAAVAMLSRELGGPPYSFTAHGPEEFERADALHLTEKIRRATFVVAISYYGRSQLCRRTPYRDWRKLVVVHCGVDSAFLRARAPSVGTEPRLVCVARLSEQKGHFVLFEALAQLKAAAIDFELLLLGDGPLRGELMELARTLGLEKHVQFGGWADENAVRRAISASRGMVLPSFAEGLPVVLMEALALRRPVVSTGVCGVPELVDSGCGWLVPAGSSRDLANALGALLRAPSAALDAMGNAGRDRVAIQHDVQREAARLFGFFKHGPGEPQAGDLAAAGPGHVDAPTGSA